MSPPYHWISDPAHGWLVVPIQDVVDSGFKPSPASFVDPARGLAYLEEDCDAPGFVDAVGVKRSVARRWKALSVDWFDRTLPRWEARADAA